MSKRILVIDDEPNIRTMMRLALDFAGYQVETAANGSEGLDKFGNGESWDLVLLDQRMPGMSGSEVQAEIRRRNPGMHLILITAFGTIDMALEAMKSGAVDFLRKPFSADTLRSSVQAALVKKVVTSSAIPADAVLGAFTRSTINGYNFNLLQAQIDDRTHERAATFEVARPDGTTQEVTVKMPPFVMELVKAYADCEKMPGEERFWVAMTEEALADYLWQNAELPPSNLLVITDLGAGLQRWLDGIFNVDCTETQNV
jgi:FixJ family two-component response regulator